MRSYLVVFKSICLYVWEKRLFEIGSYVFKRKGEYESLENLEFDYGIEKKNLFFEEKFKLVVEICISSKSLTLIFTIMGKMFLRYVRGFYGSFFNYKFGGLGRKNSFMG